MRILLISNKDLQCGVADYGRRLYGIIAATFDMAYQEVANVEEYNNIAFVYNPDVILYNYHHATLPWVNNGVLDKNIKHIAIFHEGPLNFTPDKVIDTSIRPLFEDIELAEIQGHYILESLPVKTDKKSSFNATGETVIRRVPVIGSFGFGFPDKNFPRIAEEVAMQYDEAIIRLNIPFAEYGDKDGFLAMQQAEKCREILKGTKIQLEVNHSYLDQDTLLAFLRNNDINLFLYKQSHGRGIASAIDYALSAYRPIGVSNSEMFRHLPASVCIDNTPIKELTMQQLLPVYDQHSNKRLVEKYKSVLCE